MEYYIPKKRTWKEKFKRFFLPYPPGIDDVYAYHMLDRTIIWGIIGKREYPYFKKDQALDCYVKDYQRILGKNWAQHVKNYERWKKDIGI